MTQLPVDSDPLEAAVMSLTPSPNPGPSPNQAALTWFYLVKRAEYLTSNLMDSCRDELLKLWEREGLVRLAGVRVRVNV